MALSPRGRVSFPTVYVASAMEEGQTPKFSVTLLFKLDEMDAGQKQLFADMGNAANKAAIEKFGVKLGEEFPADSGKKLKSPFRKSEEKPKYLPPGHIFVKFSTISKPGCVDEARDPIDQVSGDFYAGCYAHASWTVYAYDKGGNPGVAFGLKNVQKTSDGEAFGAEKSSPDDDFEVIPVSGDDDIDFS
jgi:hypothetical protein